MYAISKGNKKKSAIFQCFPKSSQSQHSCPSDYLFIGLVDFEPVELYQVSEGFRNTLSH